MCYNTHALTSIPTHQIVTSGPPGQTGSSAQIILGGWGERAIAIVQPDKTIRYTIVGSDGDRVTFDQDELTRLLKALHILAGHLSHA